MPVHAYSRPVTPDILRVSSAQALWLVGGRQKDADELLWKVPGLAEAGTVLIPQEPFAMAYSQEMGMQDGAPSTGFVGERDAPSSALLHRSSCIDHAPSKLWSGRHAGSHAVS